MAQTIPDIMLDHTYQDINTLTGIPVGTQVIVQFKGNYVARVQFNSIAPDDDSLDGNILEPIILYEMGLNDPRIWITGRGRISVQVA